MTKKIQKVDKSDLDKDLDFNDFEMGFESLGGDREPSPQPAKSFAKGVKKGLSDTEHIKKIFKNNLPSEYGKTLDLLDEITKGGKDFTEEVIKDAKPIIGDLADAADKFLPASFKRTKAKLDQIKRWSAPDASYEQQTKEQLREQNLGIEIGRIFDQQAQDQEIKEKINKREKALDRSLSLAQHQDVLSVLVKIANSTAQNTAYTTSINSAWQKKTLETQYRSLFVLKDILEEVKYSNGQIVSNLMAITKNSALPDYAKTNRDEAFFMEMRKRFSSSMLNATGNFFQKGISKIKQDVKGTISDIGSVTSMVSMMADMHNMSQELDPKALEDMIAEGGGSYLGKWLTAKGGDKLFQLIKKNPKLVEKIVKGKNFLGGFQDDLPGLSKHYMGKLSERGGGIGALMGYLNNSFEFETQGNRLNHFDSKSMYNASPFTNKVAYSITDVIPGYLARILQEQTRMRTGQDSDIVKFDYRTGKFDTSRNIVESISKTISSDTLSRSSEYYYKDIMSNIEEHVDLNDKERSEIAKILLKKGSSGESLNPEVMTDSDKWADHTQSYELAQKLAHAMTNIYGTTSDKEFFSFNQDPQRKANALEFNKKIRGLSSLKRDFASQAQVLIDSGLLEEAQKAQLIDEAGLLNIDLIDKNTATLRGSFKGKGEVRNALEEYSKSETELDGYKNTLLDYAGRSISRRFKGYKVNDDGYLVDKNGNLVLDKDGKPTPAGGSDINVKQNIQKPKGSVLEQISRIPIFNWNYKKGHYDGGKTTNMGPMAQDLNKEFGDEMAPGGTTIDLVNANGVTMKAVQELNDKVSSFFGDDNEPQSSYLPQNGLAALRGIYHNTSILTKQQGALLNINVESLKSLASGLGTALGKVDLTGVGKEIQSQYNTVVEQVKKSDASTLLGKIGDFISNNTGSVISSSFNRAKTAFNKASTFLKGAKDTVWSSITGTYDDAKLKALETFDVYVEGEQEPRMISLKIKKGYYLDFDTQEPVKTRKDIRSIKTGIIEIDPESTTDPEFVVHVSELEKVYFKNVYKTTIEKAIESGSSFVKNKTKTLINSFIKPSFRNAKNAIKSVFDGVAKLVDKPVDIYIKGKLDKPVLLAKRMREGHYTDQADDSVISRPSQIKGAVFDMEKSEVALTAEEFREGLVDVYGNPVGSPWSKIASTVVGAGAGIAGWGLKKIAKMPGMLGRLAAKGGKLISSVMGNLPGVSFGFFGQESVDVLKDIRSILKFQAGLGGDNAELSKIAGKTITSTASSAAGLLSGGMASFSGKQAANDTNVNAANETRPERVQGKEGDAGSLFKLAGGAASLVSGAFSLFKKKRTGGAVEETQDTEEPNKDKKQSLLEKISSKLSSYGDKVKNSEAGKKVAKIGADGKQYVDGLRKGSWQEREANATNVNSPVERDKAKVRVYATKNIFSMIGDMVGSVKKKLSDWLGRKGDPAELAEDIADGDWGDNRRRRKRKGKWFSKPKSLLGTALRVGSGAFAAKNVYDAYGNIKEGNYGDAAIDAGQAALGGAFALGGFGGLKKTVGTTLGAVTGGSAKTLLKRAGIAGAAYGAYSAYDNYQQGNYGSAAVDGALATGTAVASVGGIGALTGAGSAIASGLSALGPIGWGVLGAGAALYGGYKLYQRLTRKKFNFTEKYRMLEYGVRGGDDDLMRKFYQLEQYLETVSKTSDGEWAIDTKKFDFKPVFEIFDIDPKNQAQVDTFNQWFVKRFKPIFGKWKILVKQVSGEDKIEWLEKASTDKLLEVYKNFTMSYECYSVAASPFGKVLMNTDVQVLKSAKDMWLQSLKDDAAKNKDSTTGKAIAETGAALVQGRKEGKTDEEIMKKFTDSSTLNSTASDLKAPANVNAAGAVLRVESTAGASVASLYTLNKVSALQTVIFKAYGLSELKMSYLISIRTLEDIVVDNIKIDSSGKAVFDGDATKILEKAAGSFGVTVGSEKSKDWLVWFTNRFLPVYLGLHSCLFSITKRTQCKTNLQQLERLTASEALLTARAIIGIPGIWSIKEFAFQSTPANSNPASCDSNINYLEQTSKEEIAQEQKLAQSSPTTTTTTQQNKVAKFLDTKPVEQVNPTPKPVSTKDQVSLAQAVGVDDVEHKSYSEKGSASKASSSTISNGSVSSLVSAPGELLSGAGAMNFLKLEKGANINGLHPSVKRLFLGMVEEYGQMTGKSVQVNTAYRSFEEQAKLYKQYGPGRAARPGSSLHEFGLALDVQSTDLEQLDKLGLLRKYGFTRPLGSEPWHIEPAGIHDAQVRARAKKDHDYATSFIESGIGRGGGGLGSRGRNGELKRDDSYAKSLFEAASREVSTAKNEQAPAAPMTAAAKLSDDMTKAAKTGASSPLATGMPEAEPNQGAIPSSVGSNSPVVATIKNNTQAANDELKKTSYDLTSQVKGTVGAYTSLPESTGKGWTGNGLLIKEAAKMVGVDPGLAAAIAAKESSLNPSAVGKVSAAGNNAAQGMYQFMPGTWADMVRRHGKKYGIAANTSPMDARANTLMGLEYIKESLSKGDGSAHEAYLGHFLGPTGLSRFRAMADQDIPANILTSFAANNPAVFYHNSDKSRPRTKAEMIEYVNTSLNKQLAEFNIPLKIGSLKQPAANDSSVKTESTTSVAGLSQSPSLPTQKVSYTPPAAAPAPSTPAVQSMVQDDPVRTSNRTAPVVENNKNGYAAIEKITSEHLVVSKRTNDLLTEIRDVLKMGFAQASKASAPTMTPTAQESTSTQSNETSASRRQATELPSSYVQRKRA